MGAGPSRRRNSLSERRDLVCFAVLSFSLGERALLPGPPKTSYLDMLNISSCSNITPSGIWPFLLV